MKTTFLFLGLLGWTVSAQSLDPSSPTAGQERQIKDLFRKHPTAAVRATLGNLDRTDASRVLIWMSVVHGSEAPMSAAVVDITKSAWPSVKAGRHVALVVNPDWLDLNLPQGQRQLVLVYVTIWINQLQDVLENGEPGEAEHFMSFNRDSLTADDIRAIFPRDLEAQLAMCRFAAANHLLDLDPVTRSYRAGGVQAMVALAISESTQSQSVAKFAAVFKEVGAWFVEQHTLPPTIHSDLRPSDSRSHPRVVFYWTRSLAVKSSGLSVPIASTPRLSKRCPRRRVLAW